MKRKMTALVGALAFVAVAAPQFAHAVPAFAIGDNGATLLRFGSNNTSASTVGTFSDGVSLSGLDFRPTDGLLYGYSHATSSIYTVNTQTAALTLVSTINPGTTGTPVGIDFNPVPNALRIVSAADDNLRIAGGAPLNVRFQDGTLTYAGADANFGVNPTIVDAAYTNADTNAATGTTLYYIDVGTGTLVTTAAPNAGTLNTVGSLGVTLANSFAGLDILTDEMGNNTAYALLAGDLGAGLYTINLAMGAASFIGNLGTRAFGLAVAQPNSQIPEPGVLGLLALAGVAGVAMRRRR
jgi:hypothetical protein